ncbi:hypothetical protein [Delftia tsuruhatensis]|uniref:hypothetical protein n=1 Tax=Delftia tsuruhatensis TaxID=180282 RepID=UPI000AEBBD30|nr:hypothetical protein [Delftia tsuruhatensis]
MKEVEALMGFTHNGSYRRGDRFRVPEPQAEALKRKGLVRVLADEPSEENPTAAAGQKSSASPAAPASQKPTAGKRGSGGAGSKAAQSS